MLLGVDVGGTFTDAVLAVDGRLVTAKSPTTPGDQSAGVMAAVRVALERAGRPAGDVRAFAHGMTVATNALLEGRGARTALLATEGFTDVVELGRQARPELYRLCAARPAPLVPPDRRIAVPERAGPGGVVRPLEPAAVDGVLGALAAAGSDDVWLEAGDVAALLDAYGIPRLEQRDCTNPEQAVAAAAEIDGPVVVKALFPAPAQAAEVDAVLLGLEGETAVRAAWSALRDRVTGAGREWHGASVQPLAEAGVDVLVGAVNHRDLGVVTGVGVGGRHAGLPGDVAFRLAPATDVEAEELLSESPVVATWLQERRAGLPPDRDALESVVLRLTRLFEDVPELMEGDLNPLRVSAAGATVLDARLRAAHRTMRERIRTW